MEKKQILSILLTAIFINLLIGVQPAKAQSDEGFIYGKITTIDNKPYTGAIRWGKEEVFWSDIFNSAKTSNEYIQYLSRRERRYLDRGGSLLKIFGITIVSKNGYHNSHTHSFACQFGDIKTIYVLSKQRVEVELKNGEIIALKGGSNDIGATVRIFDEEIGRINLKWRRIEKVEFMETPSQLKNKFGEPLYGTVETYYGNFTGFIQWDHDERLSTDELDGDTREGDVSIAFGKIKSIERDGRGSLVQLQSGRELYLTGSNDVNRGNRGIIVTVPELGRVDISWRDFIKVTFDSKVNNSGLAYNKYGKPEKLNGTVTTIDGDRISGVIVYDLDETWDLELLHGNDDDLEYIIPFRNIKKITPKSYKYSTVELKNGERLRLGDKQDVTDDNDGILVFINDDEPIYIPWQEVEEIVFR